MPNEHCLIFLRALQENNFQQPGERFRSFDPARQERFVTRIAGLLSAPRVTQVGQALQVALVHVLCVLYQAALGLLLSLHLGCCLCSALGLARQADA